MKLIIAIVNNDDAYTVSTMLRKANFPVTKISSTGGFLMSGNTTFLLGVADSDVEAVIDIISKNSKKRVLPAPIDLNFGASTVMPFPAEVTVGGATIFVLNIEDYRHV
ncbi:MAG TPA: cyclic-di-AMP receptor [Bacillota bacterium]|nr:transcriptional regulator [Clostridiales bacterium]HPT85785.1 cyclic-di-AMP receptor [Bacillota bacterium]